MATQKSKMPYGMLFWHAITIMPFYHADLLIVRLGNSGLKVSKIILGTMSYGDPEWNEWALGEEEGIKHIKFA